MELATLQGTDVSHTTIGITDLMTSLADTFILLFAAQSELQENKEDV